MAHNSDPLAALLQAAGPRATAPADRANRVEAAVRLEWHDAVQKRLARRRAGWIAASCLTSAALVALVLHAHVGQPAPPHITTTPLSAPRPVPAMRVAAPRENGSYFRANDEDRLPDGGLRRHVLASYSWETR